MASKAHEHRKRTRIPLGCFLLLLIPTIVIGTLVAMVQTELRSMAEAASASSLFHGARKTSTTVIEATLVPGLLAFKDEHGTFPASLDALVPSHLAEVPACPANTINGWRYWTHDDGQIAYLGFGAGKYDYPCHWLTIPSDPPNWYYDY